MFFPAFRLQDMMQKNSLGITNSSRCVTHAYRYVHVGNRGWVEVIENYRRKEWLEQYKAEHGGRLPPDPPLKAITKAFFPCCYKEKVHITVGADMEARHRNN